MVPMAPSARVKQGGELPRWVALLPVADRECFTTEYTAAPAAKRERLLLEWQHTVALHAEPALARRLRRSIEV